MKIVISTIRININQNLNIYNDGSKFSYKGLHHEADGPACDFGDGNESWFLNGEFHRKYGPARKWIGGDRWWFRDKIYSQEKFMEKFL